LKTLQKITATSVFLMPYLFFVNKKKFIRKSPSSFPQMDNDSIIMAWFNPVALPII
jgi:hypothetical protein